MSSNFENEKVVAVVGGGPAGMMAASLLALDRRLKVLVFERRAALGWKLLVAGSSRLNVSHDGDRLEEAYGEATPHFQRFLSSFSREDWLHFLARLGQETFLGTSGRWLLKEEKAAHLLMAWRKSLLNEGVGFRSDHEWNSLSQSGGNWRLGFSNGSFVDCKYGIFALGSPAWEDNPPPWPKEFQKLGVSFRDFYPTNCGYSFQASPDFFEKNHGKPIKGLRLTTARGSQVGELIITHYGLEGTPIYRLGCPGEARLDLKPDLSEALLAERLSEARGNLEKRLRFGAKLSEGALALASEFLPKQELDFGMVAGFLKSLPLTLLTPRPLTESISAGGGICFSDLDEDLQLRKYPGLFCAGEMVDWWAPTGGYLIQGAVSMGAHVALKVRDSAAGHRKT